MGNENFKKSLVVNVLLYSKWLMQYILLFQLDGELLAQAKIEYFDENMSKRFAENKLTFKYNTMQQVKKSRQVMPTFPVQGGA